MKQNIRIKTINLSYYIYMKTLVCNICILYYVVVIVLNRMNVLIK